MQPQQPQQQPAQGGAMAGMPIASTAGPPPSAMYPSPAMSPPMAHPTAKTMGQPAPAQYPPQGQPVAPIPAQYPHAMAMQQPHPMQAGPGPAGPGQAWNHNPIGPGGVPQQQPMPMKGPATMPNNAARKKTAQEGTNCLLKVLIGLCIGSMVLAILLGVLFGVILKSDPSGSKSDAEAAKYLQSNLNYPSGTTTVSNPSTAPQYASASVSSSWSSPSTYTTAGGRAVVGPGTVMTGGITVNTGSSSSTSDITGVGVAFTAASDGSVPTSFQSMPASRSQSSSTTSLTVSGGGFSFPSDMCDDLGEICHDILCYEVATTSSGQVTRSNVMNLVTQCGDSCQSSCFRLLDLPSSACPSPSPRPASGGGGTTCSYTGIDSCLNTYSNCLSTTSVGNWCNCVDNYFVW